MVTALGGLREEMPSQGPDVPYAKRPACTTFSRWVGLCGRRVRGTRQEALAADEQDFLPPPPPPATPTDRTLWADGAASGELPAALPAEARADDEPAAAAAPRQPAVETRRLLAAAVHENEAAH